MQSDEDYTLFHLNMVFDVAIDYFRRMGGAGQYSGFKGWEPAALVLLLAFLNHKRIDQDEFYEVADPLPSQLLWGCDGLAERLKTLSEKYYSHDNNLEQDVLLHFWQRFTPENTNAHPYCEIDQTIRKYSCDNKTRHG